MPKLALLNQIGQTVGDINLADEIFAVEPNDAVVFEVVKAQRAAMRHGTQCTKGRSQVSGGGRKPWRQKGTGHARQGSIRAPQWVGGGIAFGPTPRSYDYKVNRKIRRLALKVVLSDKVREANFIVLDNLTKGMVDVINNQKVSGKIMVLLDEVSDFVGIASHNLPNVQTTVYEHASVYDIMNNNYIVTTQSTIKKIEEVLLG
jgi:large subunit ribosomal protein L4